MARAFWLFVPQRSGYISYVAKTDFLVFRVNPELKRELQRLADQEQRTVSQVCEMLLYEAIDLYKKDGAKYIQCLVAKQKSRSK
jgi:hypothetical protein